MANILQRKMNLLRKLKNYKVTVKLTMGSDVQEIEINIPAKSKSEAMVNGENVLLESFKVKAVKCRVDKSKKGRS